MTETVEAQLTPAQERVLAEFTGRIQTAINRLVAKHNQLMGTAGRAPAGSNRRKKALAIAQTLKACAQELSNNPDLAAQLNREGLLDAGWERLGRRIADHLRKTGAKP